MLQTYQGVVENGNIALPKQAKLSNGTPVLIVPQIKTTREWLSVQQAARRFRIGAGLIRQWLKSAKVRVHPENPSLVNVDDLEDAIEQNELFSLTIKVIENEEDK